MATLISPPNPPSRIFDKLYLGTLWNAKKLLERNPGFGLVLNCAGETVPQVPGVMVLQIGLLGGQLIPDQKIDYAVRVLQEFLRSGSQKAARVCCHAGRSRSPAIVLACLLGSGMGFNEACNLRESCHPATPLDFRTQLGVHGPGRVPSDADLAAGAHAGWPSGGIIGTQDRLEPLRMAWAPRSTSTTAPAMSRSCAAAESTPTCWTGRGTMTALLTRSTRPLAPPA